MKQRLEKRVRIKITDEELMEKLDAISISEQRDRSNFSSG